MRHPGNRSVGVLRTDQSDQLNGLITRQGRHLSAFDDYIHVHDLFSLMHHPVFGRHEDMMT